MRDKQIVFKCTDCEKINMFSTSSQGGNVCVDCKGTLTQVGELAENTNRTIMMIKQNHLSNKDRAKKVARIFKNDLDNGIISPIDQHMKIILMDRFTGEILKEI